MTIIAKFEFIRASQYSEQKEVPAGWFVISSQWFADKPARRISHGKWYRIKSESGCVYRILRFSPNLKGSPKIGSGQIVLDWPGWIDLNGRSGNESKQIELSISRAPWWKFFILPFSHPDPSYRLAALLGLISILLGVLSLILTLILG